MDLELSAAARALARGEVLSALALVALREDAAALALRGVAMAQLGELPRAKELLRRARRSLTAGETVARARVIVAESEVALALRELSVPARTLAAAREVLRGYGDRPNVAFAGVIEVQRLVLSGKLSEAHSRLSDVELSSALPSTIARAELARMELASRRIDSKEARAALLRARRAALRARNPALVREVEAAARALSAPVARVIVEGREQLLDLADVERLLASKSLLVDALKRRVVQGRSVVALSRRPVLFALARALGESFPADVSRVTLIARAFGPSHPNDSHRARLRVEIARLRRALVDVARVEATPRGFLLLPRRATEVTVLAPPDEGEHGSVRALLSDGRAWSSSAVATALGMSQRSVQRVLVALEAGDTVRSHGRGPARRWVAPAFSGFTPTLLLPGLLHLG